MTSEPRSLDWRFRLDFLTVISRRFHWTNRSLPMRSHEKLRAGRVWNLRAATRVGWLGSGPDYGGLAQPFANEARGRATLSRIPPHRFSRTRHRRRCGRARLRRARPHGPLHRWRLGRTADRAAVDDGGERPAPFDLRDRRRTLVALPAHHAVAR